MNHLTLIYAYYENPAMLTRQYAIWRDYPEDLKDSVSVIVVDDASPKSPAMGVPRLSGLPRLQIYRVFKDIPWHQDGARNLGASQAPEAWMFLSDMDHVLPSESLHDLLTLDDKRAAYTFARLDAPSMLPTKDKGGRPKPHPNTFAMTRAMYWQVGGYDEVYCGTYGTDGEFAKRLYKVAKRIHLDHIPIVRYSREVIPDASTTTLVRRSKENEQAKLRAAYRKKMIGPKITTLNFEWEREL